MSSTTKLTDMGWGGESYRYTSLTEPLLTSELIRLSSAKSIETLMPSLFNPASIRTLLARIATPFKTGPFQTVSGHAGHATVDHVLRTLPNQIRTNLQNTPSRDPDHISNLLVDSVVAFDHSIEQDFLRLVPDLQTITQMSDDQLRAIVHDIESSPEKNATISNACTVVLPLLPSSIPLDTISGLPASAIVKLDNSGKWSTSLLSSFHNGRNRAEVERIHQEHPDESECVYNSRVLGAIAVTRGQPPPLSFRSLASSQPVIALGDFEFKLPAVFTDRILARTNPGFKFSATTLPAVLARILTPPYLSSRPDVQHVSLADRDQYQDIRLIMCSDGLLDLYLDASESLTLEQLPSIWLDVLDNRDTSSDAYNNNLALALLRHAIGGNDLEKVSRNITVKLGFRWMDDTTILVQRI
ncbi:hypothetical protein D9756_007370 [Leucocoprinus leucothites]|uniref:PPM-type phosphatase domain-containing protein n=1 Tax=Leucocoprinus leucothites TaxID=201217 RepID=A0A8H5FWY7_9AGAR|nr:hypothetical protein D9756_007370 [Leucoagaricus leucothites]